MGRKARGASMTSTEFIALRDKERDALVAEKCMGWTNIDRTVYGEFWGKHPHRALSSCPISPYSTRMQSAWAIVAKVFPTQFCLSLGDDGGDWVVFPTWHSDSWDDSSRAPTAPLAICLAALKAKGVITDGSPSNV